MHNINHQNRHITQTTAPTPQITETLMPWCVNDQQPWDLHLHWIKLLEFDNFRFDFIPWEESGADLLSDPAGLAFLHVGVSDAVQEGRFAGVHVSQDADDGGTHRGFGRERF
jgi:hypothetical protein